MIERYYYIMFKVIKEYPESRVFVLAIDGILGLAHRINSLMLVDIVQAMQESHESMREIHKEMAERESKKNKLFMNHPGFVALMVKRLSTVYSSVEISQQASFMEEMEESVSITCFYQLLLDMAAYQFSFENFEYNKRVKILELLDKIFLKKKFLALECLSAFARILTTLCVQLKVTDLALTLAFMQFIHISMSVYSGLTRRGTRS